MFVVVVLCAGAGFTLGRLFAGSRTPQAPGASEQDQSTQVENLQAKGSADDSLKTWYFNLDPVVANLDVADVTRYVRASLILEVSSEVDEKKGRVFLDEKKPILTNWLTVYLASLGLDDIRGDSSLKRVQSQILDVFNEKLFPDSKPKIKRILFKEFAVQ
jgi:flagellar basal body-associated protein FliL